MKNTKLIHYRNFSVYFSGGIFMLWGAWFLKEYLRGAALSVGITGMLVIVLKILIKFLPLITALLIEYALARQKGLHLRRFFSWKKSRLVDLYCFVLAHLHKAIGLLNIVFTFGIPLLLDRLITKRIPAEFSLYSLIEKNSSAIIAAVIFVIVASFFSYWEHRIWHTKLMWPIHRFHHSATEFNAFTETRKHFTEVLMTPLFFTLPMSLLGAPVEFVMTYLSLILFQGFMNHTDQDIHYGWIGRYLWSDPVYHKLHHSSAPEHMNKNFSGTLPVWDRLFGTYIHDECKVAVGVPNADHYENFPYWKIYIKDFCDFSANIVSLLKDTIGRCRLIVRSGS